MAVSLDVALCSLTFGGSCDIQLLADFEISDCDHLTNLVSFAVFDSEFRKVLLRSYAGFFKMSRQRLLTLCGF